MPSAAPRHGGLAIVHFTGPVSSGSPYQAYIRGLRKQQQQFKAEGVEGSLMEIWR